MALLCVNYTVIGGCLAEGLMAAQISTGESVAVPRGGTFFGVIIIYMIDASLSYILPIGETFLWSDRCQSFILPIETTILYEVIDASPIADSKLHCAGLNPWLGL